MRKRNQPGCPCCNSQHCCYCCNNTPRSWRVAFELDGDEYEYTLSQWPVYFANGNCVWKKSLPNGIGDCTQAAYIALYVYCGHGWYLYLQDASGTAHFGWHLDGEVAGPQDCTVERTLAPLTLAGTAECDDLNFSDATITPQDIVGCECCGECGENSPQAWRVTISGHSYTVPKVDATLALSPAEASVSDDTCVWLKAIRRDFCGGRSNYIRVRLWTVAAVHNMEVALLERLGPDWYTHGIWTKTRTSGVQGPFDCTSTQTLDFSSGNLCDGPATVTAEPLQIRECPEEGSGECAVCDGADLPSQFQIEISGFGSNPNSLCPDDIGDCSTFDGTYIVDNNVDVSCQGLVGGQCTWSLDGIASCRSNVMAIELRAMPDHYAVDILFCNGGGVFSTNPVIGRWALSGYDIHRDCNESALELDPAPGFGGGMVGLCGSWAATTCIITALP
jgi:hypothetical protein